MRKYYWLSIALLLLHFKKSLTAPAENGIKPGTRVAVVTGANKGIGNAVVKELCGKFDGDVILTSRDVGRGKAAVEDLNKKGCHPKYHQLDIDDEASVLTFRDYLKDNYGGLDVLVNNAGILIPWKGGSNEQFAEDARKTVNTNFFGTRRVSNILFPLLRPHARVVNLSSMLGHLIMINGKDQAAVDLRAKLASPELTEDELVEIMNQFVESAKSGDYAKHGWQVERKEVLTYIASKIGVSALSRIQQRQFDQDPRQDLILNHCHPGRVNTDLMKHLVGVIPLIPVEQGAMVPSWLALLPPNIKEPKGDYVWPNNQIVDWVNGPAPPLDD